MRKPIKTSAILAAAVALATLSGCASTQGKAEADAKRAGVGVVFSEQEPGGTPYTLRMFVHRNFLRIEDMRRPEDYLLFDRKTRVIHAVNSADKTVRVTRPAPAALPASAVYAITEESEESSLVNSDPGTEPAVVYRYLVNGKQCYTVVSIEKMLTDVVAALREYRTVLAGQRAGALAGRNSQGGDACDVALNVSEPGRQLSHGFAVREWGANGYQRFLEQFAEAVLPGSELNQLPKDYKRVER